MNCINNTIRKLEKVLSIKKPINRLNDALTSRFYFTELKQNKTYFFAVSKLELHKYIYWLKIDQKQTASTRLHLGTINGTF